MESITQEIATLFRVQSFDHSDIVITVCLSDIFFWGID